MKLYCVYLCYIDGTKTQVGEFDNFDDAITYYQKSVTWSESNLSIDTVEIICFLR